MRLPPESAAFDRRVSYGRYVARRLRRHGSIQAADDLNQHNTELRQLGRAWEDLDDNIQEALAERDAANDEIAGTVRQLRHSLASRFLGADKQDPYRRIFPDGIAYYLAAPWPQRRARYLSLVWRLQGDLPEEHPDRAAYVQPLTEQIAALRETESALEDAYRQKEGAAFDLDRAKARWDREMEKVYAALLQQMSRAEVEAFFPKHRARTSVKSSETEA